MSLPASRIVQVSPRVISGGANDLETNGLLFTKSNRLPTDQPAMVFSSASAVSALFGPEAEETAFAQQYFAGVQNQQTSPKSLVIARRVNTSSAAWIRGGKLKVTLAELKVITDGTLVITVDGKEKRASSIDLSGATSLSDAAGKIAAAITGVSGAYDSNSNCFTFTSTTTGPNSTISYASEAALSKVGAAVVGESKVTEQGTPLAGKLGLTQAAGAVLSQGAAAMTEAANLEAVCAVTRNWVGFTTTWEATLEEIEAFSAWADVYDDFVYFPWSSDAKLTNPLTASSSPLAQIVDKYDVVAPIYFSDWRLSAMAMACGASIAWTRTQGMKTWFAKYAPGISPNVTDEADADALEANRINFIGQYATRNDRFQFFNRGTLSSDYYGFVDVLYGSIYLRSAIQTSCMNGFKSLNRIPYNARGEALIRAWCQDPINRCIDNGVIDSGLELDESQRAQIMQELGDEGESVVHAITSKGYWVGVDLPDAAGRATREAPNVTIYYAYASSVQNLRCSVVTVL